MFSCVRSSLNLCERAYAHSLEGTVVVSVVFAEVGHFKSQSVPTVQLGFQWSDLRWFWFMQSHPSHVPRDGCC